jgi:hypothetical protein
MRAVLPVHILLIDQTQIGFVNQRCRLQRVAGSFAAKIPSRQPMQFLINQRQQFIARGFVAAVPGQ